MKTKITEKFDSDGKLIERITETEGDPNPVPVPPAPVATFTYHPYLQPTVFYPNPVTTGTYIGGQK